MAAAGPLSGRPAMSGVKRALVLVRGGIAEVFADRDVRAVVADLDHLERACRGEGKVTPLHASFKPLLALAQVDYPTSDAPESATDEAWHLPNDRKPEDRNPADGLGLRLFRELDARFETMGTIVDRYGVMTLIDLWWLTYALLEGKGECIQEWNDSRVSEVLAELPSGAEYARFVLKLSELGELI
jgi:hypothetical protein